MQKPSLPKNHGEGNPEAAKRFNAAEQDFLESTEGKQKIRKGPQVRSDEESELENAERLGRARAKGDDSSQISRK